MWKHKVSNSQLAFVWGLVLLSFALMMFAFPLTAQAQDNGPFDLHLDNAYITGTIEEWQWFAEVFGAIFTDAEFGNKILVIPGEEFVEMINFYNNETQTELNYAVDRNQFMEVLTNFLAGYRFPECEGVAFADNADCFANGTEVEWFVNEVSGSTFALDIEGMVAADPHQLFVSGLGEFFIYNGGCGDGDGCALEINKYELSQILTFVLDVESEAVSIATQPAQETVTDTIFVIPAVDEGDFTVTIEIDGESAVVSREGIDVRCTGAVCTLYSRMFDEQWQATEIEDELAYLVIWRGIAQYSSLRILANHAENVQDSAAYGAEVYFVSASDNGRTLTVEPQIAITTTEGWPTNYGTCDGLPVYTANDELNRMLVLNPDGSPTQTLLNANTPVCLISTNGGSLVHGWTVIGSDETDVTLSITVEPGIFLPDSTTRVTRDIVSALIVCTPAIDPQTLAYDYGQCN